MRILVTAGNTQVPIDQVRCLTNIFTGRTGARIALEAHRRHHLVLLMTSHPEALWELTSGTVSPGGLTQQTYRTFTELRDLLQETVRLRRWDAIIHAAAVSDYLVSGVYLPAGGTGFDPEDGSWYSSKGEAKLLRAVENKIKSHHRELWLRLQPAPKLVDMIRSEWGFPGILVKFKLEAGVDEQELLDIAERSRQQSEANLMVANTLEGMKSWAYVGPVQGQYHKVERANLPAFLLEAVEQLQAGG